MKKGNKLVHKVKCLLRRLGCPRWLHRYGPKRYEFLHHLCALLVRWYCRLSYRRVKYLFDLLGLVCPSKSALQSTAAKITGNFWSRILNLTCPAPHLIAIDATGLSRTNPSYHYLKRIDGKMPKIPIKLSAAFDTRKKKFCAAKIRVLPAHEIRDAKHLLRSSKPRILVADKAYDANWLHNFCHEQNIKPHIPIRNWGKPRFRNMSQRMKATKTFNTKTYHKRELIESAFSAIKRKYGSSVSSKKAKTIRTEIYGKLVCHNIFLRLFQDSGQSPSK